MSEKTAVTEAEIAALITSCNEADGTSYGTDADADSIRVRRDEKGLSAALLSWRLGERFCGKEMEELLAFVRPDLRRQGLFTGLFREAGPSLFPYLRASVCENEGALRALSALGAEHLYDELLMERPLPFHAEDPGKEHTELSRRGSASLLRREEEEDAVRFSTPQSELYVRPLGESAFLFGVFTSSRCRGRGYGRRLLSDVLERLSLEGFRKAVLQVSSENTPAVSLYRSLGFKVSESRLQYRLKNPFA